MGLPADGLPPPVGEALRPIWGAPLNPARRERPRDFIETGVSAIDGMNTLVRVVVIVLTIQAVATIAVTVDRVILLIASYRRGRKFAKKAGPLLGRGDFQGALKLAREAAESRRL